MKLMGYDLTKEQEDIVNSFNEDNCDILIKARAGTGKTFMLLCLSLQLKNKIKKNRVISFNKFIAKEIEDKLRNLNIEYIVKSSTIHSLGFEIIRENIGKVIMNNYWIKKMVSDYFIMNTFDIYQKTKKAKKYEFVNFFEGYFKILRLFYTQNPKEIKEKMLSLGLMYNPIYEVFIEDLLALFKKHYRESIREIDFLDMLFIPVYLKMKFEQINVLFVDEAQDQGTIHHRLMKLVNPKKLVLVGDDRQAIMTFAGSLPSSLDDAKKNVLREGFKEFPLTLCRRCPVNVIKEANKYVSDIKSGKKEMGKVEDISSNEVPKLVLNSDGTSGLLFRTNLMVFKFFFSDKRFKNIAFIKNDDLFRSLKTALRKLENFSLESIKAKRKKEIEIAMENIRKMNIEDENVINNYIKKFVESWSILIVIIKSAEDKAIKTQRKAFNKHLEYIFEQKRKHITFSTVHKSKGLEFDNVFLFKEKLFKKENYNGKEKLENENLIYVGITRAKEKLYFI